MPEQIEDIEQYLPFVADLAVKEGLRGLSIHGPFNSFHEGYAVLLEEFEEFWQEVKHGRDPLNLAMEANQVAAMALRLSAMSRRLTSLSQPSALPSQGEG